MTDSAVGRAGARILTEIASAVEVERIDRLWLFPGRRIGRTESALAVISTRPEANDEELPRSQVILYRFELDASRQDPVPVGSFYEEGSAPPERIPHLIQGVLRRLGDVPEEEPMTWRIAGEPERWERLSRELADSPVDGTNRE